MHRREWDSNPEQRLCAGLRKRADIPSKRDVTPGAVEMPVRQKR